MPRRRAKSPAKSLPMPLGAQEWRQVTEKLELSPQQAKIVELLLRGLRDKQISHQLKLSVPTVRTYFSRIFERVGAQDRVELILKVFSIARAFRTDSECRHD